MIGKLLSRFPVAGEHRSPLAGKDFDAPTNIVVTSATFRDGDPMPTSCAGKGVGGDTSPQLSWTGVPPRTRQVVLIMDDVDVPLPRPVLHTVAVIDPSVHTVDAGALVPGTAGLLFVPGTLRNLGYAGPRPIPGHGPHRYRFMVFALDVPIDQNVAKSKVLLQQMAGHVLARGTLTGIYEQP